MRFTSKLAAFALLVAALLAPRTASANEAFSLNNVNDFRNNTWAFGAVFDVGAAALNVTALGAYDAGNNGFVTAGGIPVGIYRESDGTLLTSTMVTSADPLVNRFRYGAITPIQLAANTRYRVVAVNRSDLYNIDTSFNTDPAITFVKDTWIVSNVLVFNDVSSGITERVWMQNFQFNEVPEPGSVLIWSLLGVAGIAVVRRRRKKAQS